MPRCVSTLTPWKPWSGSVIAADHAGMADLLVEPDPAKAGLGVHRSFPDQLGAAIPT